MWTLLIVEDSRLTAWRLDIEDRVPQPPFKIALRVVALTATDLSSARR